MLLPGKYARNSFSKYDVRSNLKTYRHKENKEYCVIFQVDKAMRSCVKSKDTMALFRGNATRPLPKFQPRPNLIP